jgi:hypothetical protein
MRTYSQTSEVVVAGPELTACSDVEGWHARAGRASGRIDPSHPHRRRGMVQKPLLALAVAELSIQMR